MEGRFRSRAYIVPKNLGCGQDEWRFVEELYQCIITIGKMVSIFCALESYSTFTGHLKSNSIVYYWHVLMFPNK